LPRVGFISVQLKPISNAYPLRYWLRLTPLFEGIKAWIGKVLDRFGMSNKKLSLRVGNMLVVAIKPLEKN